LKKRIFILFISLIVIGCSNNFQHVSPSNNHITFDPKIDKVAVLDYSVIDILDHLQVRMDGIVKDNLPNHLIQLNHIRASNLGSDDQIDMVGLKALNPDLIIIGEKQLDLKESLKEIAPTIKVGVDPNNYVLSFVDMVNKLGRLFDVEARATHLLFDIKEDIRLVNHATTANRNTAVVLRAREDGIVVEDNPIIKSLVFDTFNFKQFSNISVDTLARYNPDFIFIIDEGEYMDRIYYLESEAYLRGRTIYLNNAYWNLEISSLRSVRQMVQSFLGL